MNDGLRVAASALRYWEFRHQVLANNLANAETVGFKGQRVFARLLEGRAPEAEAATDRTAGTLDPTGRHLDVAIEGEGYLVVWTPGGERWTRGGSLRIDDAGRLVDMSGNPVLSDRGQLVLPPGTVEIDRTGMVTVDGVEYGRLRLERPVEDVELERQGAGLYVPADARVRVPEDERRLHQGHLERSNVDPIASLVEMITIQRSHAAVERSIRVIDGVMSTISNDIGKVS